MRGFSKNNDSSQPAARILSSASLAGRAATLLTRGFAVKQQYDSFGFYSIGYLVRSVPTHAVS